MQYEQVSQAKRDEMIAEALHGREMEHCQHALNVAVYAEALKTLPDGPWRVRMQQLHDEALVEMEKIDGLHAALATQLANPARKATAFLKVASNIAAREAAALAAR